MTRDEANDLLDRARAGIDVSGNDITQALFVTGDMRGYHGKRELVLKAAKTLLAHHEAGRYCDAEALDWAMFIVRGNRETSHAPA